MVRRIRMYEDVVKAPKLTIPYLKKVLSGQGMSTAKGSVTRGRDVGAMYTVGKVTKNTGVHFSIWTKNRDGKPETIKIWFGTGDAYEDARIAKQILSDVGFIVGGENKTLYVSLPSDDEITASESIRNSYRNRR